jgi:hypothetical protein
VTRYESEQLLPALAVNIIIVHPCDVVFPRAKALGENNTSPVNNYDVYCSTAKTCFLFGIFYYIFASHEIFHDLDNVFHPGGHIHC